MAREGGRFRLAYRDASIPDAACPYGLYIVADGERLRYADGQRWADPEPIPALASREALLVWLREATARIPVIPPDL